jgi:catechol 2,3-dioxygenase-like lactoylglutathione lyase family enzyme
VSTPFCASESRWSALNQSIANIAIVVLDYDEAIGFYVDKLRFELVEDTYQPEQDKRWVVIACTMVPTAALTGLSSWTAVTCVRRDAWTGVVAG